MKIVLIILYPVFLSRNSFGSYWLQTYISDKTHHSIPYKLHVEFFFCFCNLWLKCVSCEACSTNEISGLCKTCKWIQWNVGNFKKRGRSAILDIVRAIFAFWNTTFTSLLRRWYYVQNIQKLIDMFSYYASRSSSGNEYITNCLFWSFYLLQEQVI